MNQDNLSEPGHLELVTQTKKPRPQSSKKIISKKISPPIPKRTGILGYLHFSSIFKTIQEANRLHRKNESLNEKVLPNLDHNDKAEHLGETLLSLFSNQKAKNKKIRLELLLFKMFKGSILYVFFSQTFGVLFRITLVLFAKYLLDALSDTSVDISEAFKWAGILCASLIIAVYNENHSFYQSNLLMNRIRIGLSSAIYIKITRMSSFAVNQISLGKIVNIVANDVNIFEVIGLFFTSILVGPIGLIAGGAMLWVFFGPSCLVGIAFLSLTFPIQKVLMMGSNKFREERNNTTDERIRLTNEIIEGMRILKMYTWENTLRDNIKDVRTKEVGLIKKVLTYEGASQGFAMSTQAMASFLIFLTFVLTGGELTVSIVFPTLFLIGYMKMSVVMFFAIASSFIGEVKLLLPRILDILEAPESQKKNTNHNVNNESNAIEFDNFTGYWAQEPEKEPTLKDINLHMKKGTLNALIGKVGCGKSSLLLSFTGEIPRTTGSLKYQGKIAYLEQEPTIFSGKLRDNILFGKEYQEEFYNQVISACCLDSDLKEFPDGDMSEIGERGINLSGGQKARLALARAIYSDADIYLLDDPLSAVDAKVARRLYQEAINGLLKGKTIVLVTHQVYFVREAENIILMEDGKIKGSGSYLDLKTQDINIEEIFNDEEIRTDHSDSKEEGKEENSVMIPKNQELVLQKEPKERKPDLDEKGGCLFVSEDKFMGNLNFRTYFNYFKEMKPILLLLQILLFIANELASIAFSRILGVWASKELNQTTSLAIAGSLAGLLLIIYITKTIMFYYLTVRAATSSHNKMLDKIVRCPAEFFDTNPVGRILNRFSNDMGVMDRFLPWTVCDVCEVAFSTISMLVTVAVISPYTLIPAVTATIAIAFILKTCYQCIQQSKDYELTSRSPLYSFFSSTLSGITVVRAYNQEKNFLQNFAELFNNSSKGSFALFKVSRWYGFYVDLLYTLSAVASILIITALRDSQPGLAGLSLSFILGVTGVLQFGIKGAVEMNVVMSSVSRIQAYCEIPTEAELVLNGDRSLEKAKWPQEGKVEFNDVYMRYRKNTENVIKGLTFKGKAGEKIGCIGRTGAGKSSIIQLLFRMVEINHLEPDNEGYINIDDVNIESLGLHLLRKSISIIPQTPFLFSGTIKRNLDPLGQYSDEELWKVLEEVNLKPCVDKLGNQLYTDITNVSSVFSTGQKQLVCLARTILKQSKILVLDEATANVDFETDNFIQKKVKERFRKCTTFTIAHRLTTIANYDRILVLDRGEMVEFDEPYKLLVKKIGDDKITNVKGHFSSMVLNTGPRIAQQIFEIARDQYIEMHPEASQIVL